MGLVLRSKGEKMSVSASKSFLLSSSSLYGEEESPKIVEKQGIVSILGSDIEKSSKAASLRRTLSADMSSKKWLAQNGMKKIASSQHLAMTTIHSSSSSEEDEEEEYGQVVKEKRIENPQQSDIWSTIISQKAANDDDASKLPPPYVHPLVQRSASSLSEKSLEICTESLGSETGSDVISSCPPSEIGDVGEEKEEQQVVQQHEKEKDSLEFFDREEFQDVKYNYSTTKKSRPPTRSFPPPLPSLSRSDGPSLHMHSRRQNGRLVLEAFAITSQNYFQAQRQNGRLLLTPVNNPLDDTTPDQIEEAKVDNQFEEVFDVSEEEHNEEEEKVEEDEEEMIETNVYRSAPKLRSEVVNVHRSALMIKKPMEIENRNRAWPNNCKFNKVVNLVKLQEEMGTDVQDPEDQTKVPQFLPQPPRVARIIPAPPQPATATTTTSFNSYEYFWRAKPTVASVITNNPVASTQQSSLPLKNYCSNKGYERKDLVLLRGNKADYLVPLLRGCKEPRRSLLRLDPHCIATS